MKLDFKGVKGHPPECPDGDTTEEDEDEEESRLRHRERFFFLSENFDMYIQTSSAYRRTLLTHLRFHFLTFVLFFPFLFPSKNNSKFVFKQQPN